MQSTARAYLTEIRFTPADRLEADTVRTLALLFLARVDGKSPAEYITDDADKAMIRALSYQILADGMTTFDQVADLVWHALRTASAPAPAPAPVYDA